MIALILRDSMLRAKSKVAPKSRPVRGCAPQVRSRNANDTWKRLRSASIWNGRTGARTDLAIVIDIGASSFLLYSCMLVLKVWHVT